MNTETNRHNERRSYWYFHLGRVFDDQEQGLGERAGTHRDIALAKYYYNLSGNLGFSVGYFRLGVLLLSEGDWGKAKEAFEQGAALQSVNAILFLARGYTTGAFGGNVDFKLAKKWYKKGARLGSVLCCYQLAILHRRGDGTPVSNEKGASYFRRGADKGDTESEYSLGLCYCKGEGIPKSFEMARWWSEKAAAKGHEQATKFLIVLSNEGH